ncbi:PiggyBac transposable element-derived protein 2, partial [Pseudolycoriella hygida]
KSNAGTGNLAKHLQKKHTDDIVLDGFETDNGIFVFSQEKFRKALIKWIVICDQPFTEPQQQSFVELVQSLNPNAELISDKTVRADIIATYEEMLGELKASLCKIPGKISISLDGWTSRNILPFLAIRRHWFDVDWNYHSILFDFSYIHVEDLLALLKVPHPEADDDADDRDLETEQSDSDNFSENELYDHEHAMYVALPPAHVESENESVAFTRTMSPKRRYVLRRAAKKVQLKNKINRRAAPKTCDTKTSKKCAKNVRRSQTSGINDNKSVNPTKNSAPTSPKRVKFRAAKNVRVNSENIKKNRWISGDFEKTTKFPNRAKDYDKYSSLSPTELFELFFTEYIWEHIQAETTKYALSVNCTDPKIDVSELKCFFGILIVSGYNVLPGKKFLWDCGSDMRNEFVSDSMRRERFITIMRFMHWADNSQMSLVDKVWKVRPVVDMLQTKFLENFVPTEHLNYDESMIKYYGRHSMKQLIRGKPIRFGYKVWCMNAENGYLISFEIYQGAGPKPNEAYNMLYGKCTAPLVKMLDNLPEKDLPYQIFTDNLFTSVNLMTSIRKRGYGVTGTVRKNRLPNDLTLPTKTEMDKKNRGSFESAICRDDGYMVVRWKDNAVVTMASTTYGVHPLSTALRYSKTEKK